MRITSRRSVQFPSSESAMRCASQSWPQLVAKRSRACPHWLCTLAVALLASATLAEGFDEDPNSHLHPPSDEDLATACQLDLRPLTSLALPELLDFSCSEDGILTEVRLPFAESDPFAAISLLFDVLGLDVGPDIWLPMQPLLDEETGVVEHRFVRLQEQGMSIAGADLVVSSYQDQVFSIAGPMLEMRAEGLSVELGIFDRESWGAELGVEVEGPMVVWPELPWDQALSFGEEPVAVFAAQVDDALLWLDSFGNELHRTFTRPAQDFLNLSYYEAGCREALCVAQAVDSVLALRGMSSVQNDLRTRKRYGWTSGRQVVIELLQEYQPWLEGYGETAVQRAAYSLKVQALFRRVFDSRSVPAKDREYLANVTHAIWVELNLHRAPVNNSGMAVLVTHPRIGWSLDDYSAKTVSDYLVGDVMQGIASAKARRVFQFMHYPKAASVMLRMRPFHADLQSSQQSAILRVLEAAADAQVHYNHYHAPRYTTVLGHEMEVGNDLAEAYQRRIGGCGLPSAMAAVLARALNLPAAMGMPPATSQYGPTRDGHRHTYFPTLARWVHGDALASAPGIVADVTLRSEAALRTETLAEHFRRAMLDKEQGITKLHTDRGISCPSGIPLKHNRSRARSWFTVAGAIAWVSSTAPSNSMSYAVRRFSPMGAVQNGSQMQIPVRRYPLLDEVAAYLPLDAKALSAGKVEQLTLRGIDGLAMGAAPKQIPGRKGNALQLYASTAIDIPDQAGLRRNNEEMSLSLHYQPSVSSGQVIAGTLLQLADRQAGSPSPYYRLAVDSQGVLRFDLRHGQSMVQLASTSRLAGGNWYHLVVTFAEGGQARLYVDGQLEATLSYVDELDFGGYDQTSHTLQQKPLALQLGGGGFVGALDELLLFVGELSAAEVLQLKNSY